MPTTYPVVDRRRGIIKNVKVLGLVSTHGRRYLSEAVQQAVKRRLYEKCLVVVEQKKGLKECIGWLEGAYVDAEGGISARRLQLKDPASGIARCIMTAAEQNPSLYALSHNAFGDSRKGKDGLAEVTRINKVESVRLCLEGATTSGLFSARKPKMRFTESVDDMGRKPPPVEYEHPDSHIHKALKQACHAVIEDDSLEHMEKASKIKGLLQQHARYCKGRDEEESAYDEDSIHGPPSTSEHRDSATSGGGPVAGTVGRARTKESLESLSPGAAKLVRELRREAGPTFVAGDGTVYQSSRGGSREPIPLTEGRQAKRVKSDGEKFADELRAIGRRRES